MSHDTDGETALIPAEVMRYSLEKSTEVNIETSLRVLASPGEPSSSILLYFLNHRWRWCRFASPILKTRLLASCLSIISWLYTITYKSRLTQKKLYKKKLMLFLASMRKTGLNHDIFFEFSLGPFEVVEVE